MEDGKQSLVSRLDHLDFIMKYLEGKQNLAKWNRNCSVGGSDHQRQSTPLDLAVREAYCKGSLIDRVTFLEQRLFQICLEIESNSKSSSSQAFGHASRSQLGSKGEQSSSSSPTFNNPNLGRKGDSLVCQNDLGAQEKSQTEERGRKNLDAILKQKLRKNGTINRDDQKVCKNEKKRVSQKWPHLKILGC